MHCWYISNRISRRITQWNCQFLFYFIITCYLFYIDRLQILAPTYGAVLNERINEVSINDQPNPSTYLVII